MQIQSAHSVLDHWIVYLLLNLLYYSGLGLKEFLDFIEDVGMQPIMAVWAGFSFGETVAADDMGPFIQEAIDQVCHIEQR